VTALENPLHGGPAVLTTGVGGAEGARAAAAALACAGADTARAALLVDLGGRAPRPTLLASAPAQALAERLAAHLPAVRIAARGTTCHLSAAAGPEGLAVAASAVDVARGCAVVVHLPPALLAVAAGEGTGLRASGVLLRAELGRDRALVALAARGLMAAGLEVAVLKRRLGWVVERRALFGALQAGADGGLPAAIVQRLLGGLDGVSGTGSAADPVGPLAA
jgi:hypothetical protein